MNNKKLLNYIETHDDYTLIDEIESASNYIIHIDEINSYVPIYAMDEDESLSEAYGLTDIPNIVMYIDFTDVNLLIDDNGNCYFDALWFNCESAKKYSGLFNGTLFGFSDIIGIDAGFSTYIIIKNPNNKQNLILYNIDGDLKAIECPHFKMIGKQTIVVSTR